MVKLVGYKDIDHGLGPPYLPSMHRHYLYRSDKLEHGKRYYITIDDTSQTWLTDKVAKKLLSEWNIV
jgi:hypothetical protein